jgi:hypothetical protein
LHWQNNWSHSKSKDLFLVLFWYSYANVRYVSQKTIKLNASKKLKLMFSYKWAWPTHSSFSLSTFLFMPQSEWEGGSVKIAACRGSAAHFFGGVQKEVIWVIVYDMKSASLTVYHGMLQYRCLEHWQPRFPLQILIR